MCSGAVYIRCLESLTIYLSCHWSDRGAFQAASPSQSLEERYAHTDKRMDVGSEKLRRDFSTSAGLREGIHVHHRRLQSRWTAPQPTVSKAEIVQPEDAQREPGAKTKEVYNRAGLHPATSYGHLWSAVEKDEKKVLPRFRRGQRLAGWNCIIITPKDDKVGSGHEGNSPYLG